MYIYVCVYVCMYIYVCVCVCVGTYMCVCMYVHICGVYVCTCTYMCVFLFSFIVLDIIRLAMLNEYGNQYFTGDISFLPQIQTLAW